MTEAGGRIASRGEVQKGKAIYNMKNKLIFCLCGQGLLCTGYSVGCLISLAGQEDPVFVQAGHHGSERQPITFSFCSATGLAESPERLQALFPDNLPQPGPIQTVARTAQDAAEIL